MNSKTNKQLLVGTSLALALGFAVWSPVQAGPSDSKDGAVLTESQMAEHCKAMKSARAKFREDVRVQDTQLADQLSKMNTASDDRKVGLMAALLNTVVDQKIAMDVRSATAEDEMMRHMMQHMQSGKSSMACCPPTKDSETRGTDTKGTDKGTDGKDAENPAAK